MSKTLVNAAEGTKVRVIDIIAGQGLKNRLMQMGLTPGEVLEVIENSKGPVIVSVKGVTIALGRGMASKILVDDAQGVQQS
ncbi:MAG: FeoA family protein [Sulfolobales archaeon]|nr:ferrous iron transport protein A [Sulfolobales archaeon]MCX8186570.1 ferrous iron transport protein A [Sulfolobales archaeon]MDW7970080.1 FeoA family protein [Sulfolobales archaeon]